MDIETLLKQLEGAAETLMCMATDYETKSREAKCSEASIYFDDLASDTRKKAAEYYIAIRIVKERAA